MMNIRNLIKLDRILLNIEANSKKRVLEIISQAVGDTHPEYLAHEVFTSLLNRERLGSTGIGHGVAIPHGRLSDDGDTIGVFVTLNEGINFDSIDNEPVTMLFSLLIPKNSTEEHLKILAKLASFFHIEENRARLMNARSIESVYNIFDDLFKNDI
jgi:PTS system nitrogen regulatory IIA component